MRFSENTFRWDENMKKINNIEDAKNIDFS